VAEASDNAWEARGEGRPLTETACCGGTALPRRRHLEIDDRAQVSCSEEGTYVKDWVCISESDVQRE
jgi:hypothetical protein